MSESLFPLNWLLTLAYDGTAYAGWQKQLNALTVQEVLTDKLSKFYKREVPVYGTSRTDSGVHALHQQVTLRLPAAPPIPIGDVFIGLNKLLPLDIRALSLVEKEPDFQARHAAVGKAYTYLIHRGTIRSPFLGRYMLQIYNELDVELMRRAADHLLGTHDFSIFGAATRCKANPNPRKTLHRFDFTELGPILMITVTGNSFLYKMVRRLVGFLINVGRARIGADDAPRLLAEQDRTDRIETAMGHGLFLDRTFFDEQAMHDYRRTTLPYMDLP